MISTSVENGGKTRNYFTLHWKIFRLMSFAVSLLRAMVIETCLRHFHKNISRIPVEKNIMRSKIEFKKVVFRKSTGIIQINLMIKGAQCAGFEPTRGDPK